MFEYKIYKYIYNSLTDNFEIINYYIKASQKEIVEDYSQGLNNDEVLYMKKIFGICDIEIKNDSCCGILLDELTDPFYLFQVVAVIAYFASAYYLYPAVILALAIISITISVYDTYQNRKKFKEISRYSCKVKVYRKKENDEIIEIQEINSTELVPGDIYEIPEDGLSMPCDTILINGSAIVNESMLTGESTPVNKMRMSSNDTIYDTNKPDYEKYVLFAGTKIIQKRKMGNNEPLGIVLHTGFNTFKGNLIAGILYPKKEKDKFTHDSVKYIIFMGILTVVGFGISLKFMIVEGQNEAIEIIKRFLDLFATTVPPTLPACISIGITYSLSRLKDKGIYCIQRDRINKAGSVNILIFDKTGTLTEDHLNIKGFITTKINEKENFEFNDFNESCKDYSDIIIEHFKNRGKNNKNINKDLLQYYIECLACCHCLTYVNEKLVGDPIDIQMFESTNWTMKENENNILNPNVLSFIRPICEEDVEISFQDNNNNLGNKLKSRYEIAIVKRFDFSSKLQRMTVITKNLNENFFKVFCKGSPEKIKELCSKSTIPENFNDILNSFTSKGYRVLGMSGKSLIMNFIECQSIKRDEVERNMIFLGFLIVQNKLKEKTKEYLEKYDNADLSMIMATGDNILTAIRVSKECNLIKHNEEIFYCDIEKINGQEKLKWDKIHVENNESNLNDINLSEREIIETNKETQTQTQINIENESKLYLIQNLKIKTSNTLFELYPPEKIHSIELSKNEKNSNKKIKNSKRNKLIKKNKKFS